MRGGRDQIEYATKAENRDGFDLFNLSQAQLQAAFAQPKRSARSLRLAINVELHFEVAWTYCVENKHKELEQFLKQHMNAEGFVNTPHELGSSLLMTAIYNNKRDAANVLIKYGADVNHKNSLGQCALTMAVRNGDDALMRYMINLENIDLAGTKDKYGKYPIEYLDPTLKKFKCRDILANAILAKLEDKSWKGQGNQKEEYENAIKAYIRAAGDAYFNQKYINGEQQRIPKDTPFQRLLRLEDPHPEQAAVQVAIS